MGFYCQSRRNKVQAYRRMARMAGRVWRKYGALEFRECVGDDLNTKMGPSFKKAVKAKPNETVFLSWIVFRSKTDRDRVNARVMKDPRIAKMMESDMPMDPKRMYYGGFEFTVDL